MIARTGNSHYIIPFFALIHPLPCTGLFSIVSSLPCSTHLPVSHPPSTLTYQCHTSGKATSIHLQLLTTGSSGSPIQNGLWQLASTLNHWNVIFSSTVYHITLGYIGRYRVKVSGWRRNSHEDI